MANDDTNYIDEFNDGLNSASNAIYAIRSTANALARVGSPLAQELYDAISDIDSGLKQMSAAVTNELTRQVQQGHTHIAEVFLAILDASAQRNAGEGLR